MCTQNKNVSCFFSISASKTSCPSYYLYFLWLCLVAPASPFVLTRSSLTPHCMGQLLHHLVCCPASHVKGQCGSWATATETPEGPTYWIRLPGDVWSGKIGVGESAVLMCSRHIKVWDNCFSLFLSLPSLPGKSAQTPPLRIALIPRVLLTCVWFWVSGSKSLWVLLGLLFPIGLGNSQGQASGRYHHPPSPAHSSCYPGSSWV